MEPLAHAHLITIQEWFRNRGRVVDEASVVRVALEQFAASLRSVDGMVRVSSVAHEEDDDADDGKDGGWSL